MSAILERLAAGVDDVAAVAQPAAGFVSGDRLFQPPNGVTSLIVDAVDGDPFGEREPLGPFHAVCLAVGCGRI